MEGLWFFLLKLLTSYKPFLGMSSLWVVAMQSWVFMMPYHPENVWPTEKIGHCVPTGVSREVGTVCGVDWCTADWPPFSPFSLLRGYWPRTILVAFVYQWCVRLFLMSLKASESFWMFFNLLVVKKDKISLTDICSDFSCYIIICIFYLLRPHWCMR